VSDMTEPIEMTDLEVVIDYQQVYLSGAPPRVVDPAGEEALRALDDARNSGRYVGVSAGVIDILTPIQYSTGSPMRVETWAGEPPVDSDSWDNWDNIVDVDLDVPSGRLYFQPSGGGFDPVSCEVPVGRYRVRVAGRGYDQAGVEGLDSYRVQLWPRDSDNAPAPHRTWPGWAEMA
jgi:hypothetical protein